MIVISAFSGMGKTWYFENCQELHSSYDSDSSKFPKDDFPRNYIEHIKEKLKEDDRDIIFVSSHENVRQALIDEGIHFICIYPDRDMKDEMIERYKKRGSTEAFIDNIEKNYENYISSIEKMLSNSRVSGVCFTPNTYIDEYIVDEIIDYCAALDIYDD